MKERRGRGEERKRLWGLWEEIAHKMLHLPVEEFKVEHVRVEPIEPAPIFESVRCSRCNELVMANRAVYRNGNPLCLKCAGEKYYAVIGRGIVEVKGDEV